MELGSALPVWTDRLMDTQQRNHLEKENLPLVLVGGGSVEKLWVNIGVPWWEPKGSVSNTAGGSKINRGLCYGKMRDKLRHLQTALLAE